MKSAEMVGWAIGGLEREIAMTRERLSALTAQANALRAKLGAKASAMPTVIEGDTMNAGRAGTGKRRRRKMSADARKRISEMMRKRWAERKKQGKKSLKT